MFPSPYGFTGEFDQIFKEEIETILHSASRREGNMKYFISESKHYPKTKTRKHYTERKKKEKTPDEYSSI